MRLHYLQIVCFLSCFFNLTTSFSQVGINTTSPRAMLEVAGRTYISENITVGDIPALENNEESTFLIQNTNDFINKLDVSNPTGSALGYIQEYEINNMFADFVQDFDTQIDASDYVLIIISSNFNDDLNLPNSNDLSKNFSLPFSATFISNGTWHITANYPVAGNFESSNVGSWTIKTLILSRDLSKQLGTVNIQMSSSSTGSASTPVIN